MVDAQTQKPIRVKYYGIGRPSIMVPLVRLDEVQTLIDQQSIPYWVEMGGFSLDGKNYIRVIVLERAEDADRVQAILDEVQ